MTNPYWSLRNKLEDVGRALAKSDSARARMATYELGMRLGPTMSTLQSQTGSAGREAHPATSDWSTLSLIRQVGIGVNQLHNHLKAMHLELAADVVKRLFELLDSLDQNLSSGNFDPIPKAVKSERNA